MSAIPQNPSRSTVLKNPHLYGHVSYGEKPGTVEPKRLRQSKPQKLNKLETEFKAILEREWGADVVMDQKIKLILGNGVTYTPDFDVVSGEAGPTAKGMWFYEVKGPRAWDDAIVKLKVAAHQFPQFRFWLVWKEEGHGWRKQEIFGSRNEF